MKKDGIIRRLSDQDAAPYVAARNALTQASLDRHGALTANSDTATLAAMEGRGVRPRFRASDLEPLNFNSYAKCHAPEAFSKRQLPSQYLAGIALPYGVLSSIVFSARANMHGAAFPNANLRFSQLIKADIRDVNFVHADLRSANLTAARARGADFRDADFEGTIITKAELPFVGFFRALHQDKAVFDEEPTFYMDDIVVQLRGKGWNLVDLLNDLKRKNALSGMMPDFKTDTKIVGLGIGRDGRALARHNIDTTSPDFANRDQLKAKDEIHILQITAAIEEYEGDDYSDLTCEEILGFKVAI